MVNVSIYVPKRVMGLFYAGWRKYVWSTVVSRGKVERWLARIGNEAGLLVG
jgi:predicted component of type VI protein secretion system